MYTIEFQKCGLSHARFLIILEETYKLLAPEAYDQFICAKLSNLKSHSHLFELITIYMTNSPYRELNSACLCMKKKININLNSLKKFLSKHVKEKVHIQFIEDEIEEHV